MTNRLVVLAACLGSLLGLGEGLSVLTAEEPKSAVVEVQDLKLNIPENWKKAEGSRFRVAQFNTPAAEGDTSGGEFVVFHFGKEGGGGVEANIQRWTDQFEAEGRKRKVLKGTSENGDYVLVELSGTWFKPVGPPVLMKKERMPGARMLSAIVHNKEGGDYFIRLTGPEKTIGEQAELFRKALQADLKSEKEAETKK